MFRVEKDPKASLIDGYAKSAKDRSFTDELPGTALQIPNGENQHMDIGDAFALDAAKGFAVSVWVRPTQYGAIISRMDKQSDFAVSIC